jgi:hypothetical protein
VPPGVRLLPASAPGTLWAPTLNMQAHKPPILHGVTREGRRPVFDQALYSASGWDGLSAGTQLTTLRSRGKIQGWVNDNARTGAGSRFPGQWRTLSLRHGRQTIPADQQALADPRRYQVLSHIAKCISNPEVAPPLSRAGFAGQGGVFPISWGG